MRHHSLEDGDPVPRRGVANADCQNLMQESSFSKLWGSNASDKQIVKESGLLDLLEKGDNVMADKGFLIQDLLDPLGVTLNMPPKRDSNRQLSRQEVEQTRRIAAVRIHVERKIEQIKNFRILQGVIPATEWHNANNIVLICAAKNLQLHPPLLSPEALLKSGAPY